MKMLDKIGKAIKVITLAEQIKGIVKCKHPYEKVRKINHSKRFKCEKCGEILDPPKTTTLW